MSPDPSSSLILAELPEPGIGDGFHPEDAARRQRLRRNRTLATGLLLAMAAIAIGTHLVEEPGFLILLIRAGAEAGLVGGLADWFAVTALFRRPLGLPIPHTGIIPDNKDRIGRTLGRFVERNFLTKKALLRKLRNAQAGRRLAAWLTAPESAKAVAEAIVSALPGLAHSLASRELHDFAQRTVGEQLRAADLAPIFGRVMHLLLASGEADVLFERIVGVALQWLQDHRDQIDRLVSERSRWWIPKTIDRRIAAAIVKGISDLLTNLKQPESESRLKFRAALTNLIDELLNSPEQRAQINASKDRILNHPDVQAWLASIGNEISQVLMADLQDPNSKTRAALERLVTLLGNALMRDEAMQSYLDTVLQQLAVYLVSWRAEIGNFIAEVVKTWDTATVSERLELVVGSDLQYIRMNGTIVGACAGCLIFLATTLLI
jgi:uncharacterized membrane-anchored protein YjiN (DUF445 family)